MKAIGIALAALAVGVGVSQSAAAGDYNGNFMVRLQGTEVVTRDNLKSLVTSPGGADLKTALSADVDVSDRFLPTATLTYFLSRNLSVELFCCFSKHSIDLKTSVPALSGKVADSWIFPPALTLQYHFDGFGAFKPYIGAGAQWIHFFNEKTGDNPIGAQSVSISDAFGPTVQIGFDYQLGGGWYLNGDVKKSWLEAKGTWHNTTATGTDIVAKANLDPLIVSAGIGYRFNLEDLFGRREAAPLK